MSSISPRFKIQDILDRDPDKFEPHPRRAWVFIFFAEVFLLVLVFAAHLYAYIYMRTDNSFTHNEDSLAVNEVRLNRKGLADIIAMFEAKNAKFQDLLVSPPNITDPSQESGSQSFSASSSAAVPKKAASTTAPDTISVSFE